MLLLLLYTSMEKRYNFSLDELDVVANGYAHFRSFFTAQDGRLFAKISQLRYQNEHCQVI
jgi:hypothetical protein